MGDASELAEFPTDDVTLSAVEHALDSVLTFDRPADADPDDEGPWRIGSDYALDQLLDFLSGTADHDGVRVGDDLEPLTADEIARDDALGVDQTYLDERPHYTERDVIRGLIAEVRRLRAEGGDDA